MLKLWQDKRNICLMVKHNIYPQRVKYIPPWERDLHTEREKERERERVGGGGEGKVGGDRENDKRERELDIYK